METSITKAEKEHKSDVQSSTVSSEATGMRRDHESIDDFEHLEPESSPVTETSVKHSFDDDFKPKTTGDSGKDAVTSTTSTFAGTVKENQNSSEFSLLGDSKLSSVETGNTPEQLEEMLPSEFTSKLIVFDTHEKNDQTKFAAGSNTGNTPEQLEEMRPSEFTSKLIAFDTHEKNDQTKFAADSNTAVEKSLFTAAEQKASPHMLFDAPTQKSSGLDLFNRLETSPKGSDASVLSQAFMDMERGGAKDDQHSKHTGDISQPDLQHLGYKVDDILKPKTDIKEKFVEPDVNPALAHIKDDIHDDDSFKDTDSIPELTKAEEKFKDLPEDMQPLKQDVFPDYNKLGDFHAPAANMFAKGTGEFSSADDKFTDLPEDIYDVKEETKPNYTPTVKQDLEFSTPAPLMPKSTLEEKSPVKPKSGEQTAVTKSKELPSKSDDEPIIAPFALGSIGLDAWFKPDRLHPKVVELVYWRDPKKSGIVFGSVLGILLSLTYFSLISVIAYLSLTILTGTVSFRVYKTVLQAVQKTTSDGHPFKDILELDLTLPQEKVREVTDLAAAHLNAAACELRRLFLVEDLVDSIKFGVLLWCLTYVGSWFNGMTLIIIAFVALFTLPKVYETNKVQIDQNIDLVRSKIAEISSKIKATIRVGGKKPEEKKE